MGYYDRKYFHVLREITPDTFAGLTTTAHFNAERQQRHNRIVSMVGYPTKAYCFVVDKHHPNGNEIHTIFNNGIILIQNERTKLVITELIARPGQLTRYWDEQNKPVPDDIQAILPLAQEHKKLNYNHW